MIKGLRTGNKINAFSLFKRLALPVATTEAHNVNKLRKRPRIETIRSGRRRGSSRGSQSRMQMRGQRVGFCFWAAKISVLVF